MQLLKWFQAFLSQKLEKLSFKSSALNRQEWRINENCAKLEAYRSCELLLKLERSMENICIILMLSVLQAHFFKKSPFGDLQL